MELDASSLYGFANAKALHTKTQTPFHPLSTIAIRLLISLPFGESLETFQAFTKGGILTRKGVVVTVLITEMLIFWLISVSIIEPCSSFFLFVMEKSDFL